MTPRIRKLTLTAHIASSVGWFGATAGFEALAIGGLCSSDSLTARAAYVSMQSSVWFIIIPFSCFSLLTGLILALRTRWGLFRHYWILIKFIINALGCMVLLLHTRLIDRVGKVATEGNLSLGDLRALRFQLVAIGGAALIALLVAMTLAVFKPRGLTPCATSVNRPGPQPDTRGSKVTRA